MKNEAQIERHDITTDQEVDREEHSSPDCVFTVKFPRDWSAFEKRIIGVERDSRSDLDETSKDQSVDACKAYWSDTLGYVSGGNEGIASMSAKILSDLDLAPPCETLKRILDLAEIDEQTAFAANAALFTVFNTSIYGVNLDDVALGIATFIRSHAALNRESGIELAEAPFGDDTIWKLLIIPHG